MDRAYEGNHTRALPAELGFILVAGRATEPKAP